MELLLNVFWLTFALLALGVWWHGSISARSGHYNRLPQLVLLSCVLILLFPVVSVTDDLHPIRPEMEESNPLKKIKAAADKTSNHSNGFDSLSAQVDCCFWFPPQSKICGQVVAELGPVPEPAQLCTGACRAPPAAAALS